MRHIHPPTVPAAQLPLWRAVAFVGFYGVGVGLNSLWFVKIGKGAYKVFCAGGSPPAHQPKKTS